MDTRSAEFRWESLQPIPLSRGLVGVLAGVLFFSVVNVLVRALGEPATLNVPVWKWRTFFVSDVRGRYASIWIVK